MPIWNDAADAAIDQVMALVVEMRKVDEPELERMADDLLDTLNDYLVGVNDVLDEYDGLSGEQRAEFAAEALGVVQDNRHDITNDPLIAAADSNPFGLSVRLGKTLGAALDEIEAAFQA